MRDGCVFCDYGGPSEVLRDYGEVFVIEPIRPVTPGHRLVVPRAHVPDFASDAKVSVAVLSCAVRYVREAGLESYNLITSKGEPATQTVFHLHVHVVPRRSGDGLALPWSFAPISDIPEPLPDGLESAYVGVDEMTAEDIEQHGKPRTQELDFKTDPKDFTVLGRCSHDVDLDRDFCPHGCRV